METKEDWRSSVKAKTEYDNSNVATKGEGNSKATIQGGGLANTWNTTTKVDQDNPGVEAKGETNSKRATQNTRLSSTSRAQAKEDVFERFGYLDQAI